MDIQNPDKNKVGCMVPLCTAKCCTREIKRRCALRRTFLTYQAELRHALRYHPEMCHYINYWRDNEQKAD